MSGNTIGKIFRFTGFGESHGEAVGGLIDGFPPGFAPDFSAVQAELERRRPGKSELSSARNEEDEVVFLSGLFEGKTTGAPIAFLIPNKDARPGDYDELRNVYRPSHADFTRMAKYGIRDHRGGGRASARETVARVVAGALAKQYLMKENIEIIAYTAAAGEYGINEYFADLKYEDIAKTKVSCPEKQSDEKIYNLIKTLKSKGDSIGSMAHCVIRNLPAGLGEPVFEGLDATLAKAMISIPAVKAVEFGSGTEAAKMKGSDHNDPFIAINKQIRTKTNNSGGIQGGISNAMPVLMKISLKPPSSIALEQESVDNKQESVKIKVKGRHDPCLLPRALVVIEAMAALCIMDMYLRNKCI